MVILNLQALIRCGEHHLEMLDFTPLSNVDYSGGIIITDWFDNENDENSNLKISIKFLTQ